MAKEIESTEPMNHIHIDCKDMNNKATIDLASEIVKIIKKDYPIVSIKVVASKD